MKRSFLPLLLTLVSGCLVGEIHAAEPSPQGPIHLRCEGLENPLGIDDTRPRFSWWFNDTSPGAMQAAWQIQVRSGDAIKWDSGRQNGGRSVDVEYAGPEWRSGERCTWRVRTWNAKGVESPWSDWASFEMGLLKSSDWQAQWIGHPPRFTQRSMPATYLRREFAVDETVVRARLYISARGLFEAEINGRRIGNDALVPGWTDFSKRNQYLTYDVTGDLVKGGNAIGVILADGWHNGWLRAGNTRNWYGKDTSVIAQLLIETDKGRSITVSSDDSWQVATGPILEADLYNGEKYDARAELGNWSQVGYKQASSWLKPRIETSATGKLVAKVCEPVRSRETVKAKSVTRAPNGEWVFDFGQNLVGVPRIQVAGKVTRSVTLRFAEMLNPDGTLYLDNLRSAEAVDRYTFKSSKPVTWQPRFTFHGFRYVGLSGLDAEPALGSVEAVVLHTDVPVTGSFACSNPLLNQLHSNIVWGQKSNYLEVPTDCPQRDERLGWTGDAQVFVRTATYNMSVAPFFEKWMADMRDAQQADGQFPHYAPRLDETRSSAAWADAGVICPWVIYQRYGNSRILADNYEAMRRWVDYQAKQSKNLIRPNQGFGDWLAIDAPNPARAPTPKSLIGTAYFAYTANLLSQAAAVLGHKEDAASYGDLAKRVAEAFDREFVLPDGRLKMETQTGYLLALGYDLLPEAKRPVALKALLADLESRDWHLSTGFVGTGMLLPVLSRMGRDDVAYQILLKETYPGWLYSIRQGATTMWERWNSYTHEKGFGDVSMNSFNHYAYGAVGEWMHSAVVGIDSVEPGFRKILIHPQPGGGLTWAKGSLESPYGLISTDWRVEGGKFHLSVVIPPNTTAIVRLPNGEHHDVGAGTHTYEVPN